MIDYGSILRNIGYTLFDRGSYWQARALYREGDNNTSLRIYKNSGVWSDFVEGNKPLPFEILLKKTLKTENVDKHLTGQQTFYVDSTEKYLKEEKTFPKESLKKLLPDRKYFEGRGIPAWTQKEYNCGLATSGKLYQRIVFPIIRKDGEIHGFIGRKVDDNNDKPKWINYGKTADWFYPYFSVNGVKRQIEEEGRVFVVESIGDSLSLFRSGVKNNLVTFTNKIQPKFTSKISNLGVDIVLSFNNDEGQNRGFDGALTALIKLFDTVDLDRIWFCPPPQEDFGAMSDDEIREWRASLDFSGDSQPSLQKLIKHTPNAKIAKSLLPKIKQIEKQLS